MRARPLFALALFAGASASLSAQVVVDPNGSGQFVDLQTAIDTVPSGTTLRVIGGSWGPLVITKSLRIIGEQQPLIAPPPSGSGVQPPAIDLVGTGSERLVLAGLRVQGTATFPYNAPGAGIRSSGFAALYLADSEVHGSRYDPFALTGVVTGEPGIDVADGDPLELWISNAVVTGSHSGGDQTLIAGRDGPPAVRGDATRLIAVGAALVGGNGGPGYFPSPPSATPCPCPQWTGAGGDAAAVASIHQADALLLPGQGGAVFYRDPQNPSAFLPWGVQAAGNVPPSIGAGASVTAPLRMELGQQWGAWFPFGAQGTPVVLLGLPRSPLPVPGGLLFLDPALLIPVPLPAGTTVWSFVVANDPLLGGAELGLQIAVLGAGIAWSRPVLEVVRF